jgi:hypothetical protein
VDQQIQIEIIIIPDGNLNISVPLNVVFVFFPDQMMMVVKEMMMMMMMTMMKMMMKLMKVLLVV